MYRRRCATPRLLGRLTLLSALLAPPAAGSAVADQSVAGTSVEVAAAGGRRAADPVELAAVDRPLPEAAHEIVVTILVNNEARGDFFLVRDAAGGLLIRQEDAAALGLQVAGDGDVMLLGQRYVPLDAIRDVSVAFDEKRLTLTIIGKTAASGRTFIDVGGTRHSRPAAYSPRETSAFFTYGLTSSSSGPDESSSFTGTGMLGARWGDLFFLTNGQYERTGGDAEAARLMSSLTYERRDDLQRLVLGDQFTGSGRLGGTLNIGGVGFSKVYALDPYLPTRPGFNLGGFTAFASEAELYLDGRRIGEYRIPAGEFELQNVSAYGGAHTVEVLLRDPFGNERRITYPKYFSDALLREGLHEYRYSAGFLRERYGEESNEYGEPVFSAFHRYGASNSLNIAAHAEGGDGALEGGVQALSLVPRLGQLTLDLAGSTGDAGGGWSAALRHAYRNGGFGMSSFLRGVSEDFATVGARPGADSVELEVGVGLGYSTTSWGGLSFGWSETRRHSGDDSSASWATYTNDITPRSTLFLTARVVDNADQQLELSLGYTLRLQRDTRLSVHAGKTGDTDRESLHLQKSVPYGEGLGYRVFLERRNSDGTTGYTLDPSLQINGRYGTLQANPHVASDGEDTTVGYDITAAGSLVYAGGFFGASRPVNDSFAFVMADSLEGAAVQLHGEDVGRTAANGGVVIPNLTPYHVNEIGLDAGDFPMDLSVSEMKTKVLPAQWGGSCVYFDVVPMRAVFGTMMLVRGDRRTPIEYRELTLSVGERAVKATLAKGGEFYLDNLLPTQSDGGGPDPKSCEAIAARLAAGSPVIKPGTYRGRVGGDGEQGCDFELTFPDTTDVMSDLGEIVCTPPESFGPDAADAPNAAVAAADATEAEPAASPAPAEAAAPAPAPDRSFEKTLPEAFATLFGLWGLDALANDVRLWIIHNFKERLLPVYFEESGLSSTYGMEFAARPATVEILRAVNLPCLALEAGGAHGRRYVVFAGFEGDRAVVLGPDGVRNEVAAEEWVSGLEGSLLFLVPKTGAPAPPRDLP